MTYKKPRLRLRKLMIWGASGLLACSADRLPRKPAALGDADATADASMPMPIPPEAAPPNVNPLVACPSAVATGANPMIDDFEDLTPASLVVDGRAGGWYPYNDETLGGQQLLEFVLDDSTPAPGNAALHTTGRGFPTFSGFGLGLRWTETGSESCYYDASYYSGLRFWARGSASLRVTLQNPSVRGVGSGGTCPSSEVCFDAHGLGVTIGAEWQEYRIEFESVTQAGFGLEVGAFRPEQLAAIEFQLGAGTTYEMWLDDIAFVRRGATTDAGVRLPDSGALDAAPSADAEPDGGE